jgi:hypothetical protein
MQAQKRYEELVAKLTAERGLSNVHSGGGYGRFVREMYDVAAEAERLVEGKMVCV